MLVRPMLLFLVRPSYVMISVTLGMAEKRHVFERLTLPSAILPHVY